MLLTSVLVLAAAALPVPESSPSPAPPGAADGGPKAEADRADVARLQGLLPGLPDPAPVLYMLATLKRRLGMPEEAIALLRECQELHEGFDPSGPTSSLRVLRGVPEFDRIVEEVHRDFPAVQNARLAFTTTEKDLVPEGLAYDPRRDVFYMGSLNRRKIVEITPSGVVSDFVPAGRDRLLPVLGIRVDRDGTVWTASWSEEQERSELLHFDGQGRLLGRYAPPEATPHGLNDLVVRRGGDVLVTDSAANKVYRFDPRSSTFSVVPTHRPLEEPNGIALAGDDRHVFVADDFGIVRIDLEHGTSSELLRPAGTTLSGADGLYFYKGSLIAIQNSFGSARVTTYRLSADGGRVVEGTVLENRSAFTDMPTTGAIRGESFYFMANTQIDNLDKDTLVDPGLLEPVWIAVLPLPQAVPAARP
jgi:hypothetical protein